MVFLKSKFNNKNNLKKKMSLKRRGSKKKKTSHILTERQGNNYWVCTSYENLASREKYQC